MGRGFGFLGLAAGAVLGLGLPLSSFSVILSGLVTHIPGPGLKEDLYVLPSLLKRCREILEGLRSNFLVQKNYEFILRLDFIRLINEIISSYQNNDLKVIISNDSYFEDTDITIPSSAEIVPSITNVIDNAYKFANAVININLISEKESIIIEVGDDGPGFAPEIYPFLGDPYIKNNHKAEKPGLGLGLFISKTLLAKSNGQIKFSHRESGGGMVKIVLSKAPLDLLK
jgi:Osmosensitive K+ channel histidine kinase